MSQRAFAPVSRSPGPADQGDGGSASIREWAFAVAGQSIDVYVSARRDIRAARRFFGRALRAHGEPVEAVTDRAPALRAVIDELIPGAFHSVEQYANNRIEAEHGRLKARLRPMR